MSKLAKAQLAKDLMSDLDIQHKDRGNETDRHIAFEKESNLQQPRIDLESARFANIQDDEIDEHNGD